MKIFADTGKMQQSAHFGWQKRDEALYGLREGYKNSADELVNIAVNSEEDVKILDTYIFPVLFLYRHCLEITLKHIYMRTFGEIPMGGHNLLSLWDVVKRKIVDEMLCAQQFIEQVKTYKKHFVYYSFDVKECNTVRSMLKELQEANQKGLEINFTKKQVDEKAEVWRYLMSADQDLYFTQEHSIDYIVLQDGINYIYKILNNIYCIIDEYLTS